MLESTTNPATRRIFHRAHEERARAFRTLWQWLMPGQRDG